MRVIFLHLRIHVLCYIVDCNVFVGFGMVVDIGDGMEHRVQSMEVMVERWEVTNTTAPVPPFLALRPFGVYGTEGENFLGNSKFKNK